MNLTTDAASLVRELAHPDELRRQRARHELVFLGAAAVPHLRRVLSSESREVRWEAAKALHCLAHRDAAVELGQALGDDDDAVGWLAAMALIRLGREGLEPALRALVQHGNPCRACANAHHVLHELRRLGHAELVDPVIEAIESSDRETRAPVEAERALLRLQRASG